MGEYVRLEVDDGVGVVRLDRPPANAIDLQLGLELQEAIREAADTDDVGALVVWGGPKIFAAGADIKAMAEWGPDEVKPSVDALGEACDLLEVIPKISIAAVNRYALGGGMELALAADLRLLGDDARLGQPEIGIGVIPGAGGTQRLTRLVGPGGRSNWCHWPPDRGRRGVGAGADHRVEPGRRGVRCGGPRRPGVRQRPPEGARRRQGRDQGGGRDARAGRDRRRTRPVLQLFGTPDQREGMRAFLDKTAHPRCRRPPASLRNLCTRA